MLSYSYQPGFGPQYTPITSWSPFIAPFLTAGPSLVNFFVLVQVYRDSVVGTNSVLLTIKFQPVILPQRSCKCYSISSVPVFW